MDNIFKRSTPEAQGIPSEAVERFIRTLEKQALAVNSFLLFKNNSLVFEGYYKPFGAGDLHRMFSITKSFVSAAVGVLYGRRQIDIDSPVIAYFGEYDNEKTTDMARRVTVRNMLRMETQFFNASFAHTPYEDPLEAFFYAPPEKTPGTVFTYGDPAAYVLCTLVERLTGKDMLDFLRDEFLRELGFSENAYCMKDSFGRTLAGSGLMAAPMDVAIFIHIFLNEGCLGGRQLIPHDYVREAVSKQTDTWVKGAIRAERNGYGYFFWRLKNNGYMCYGLGGQVGAVFPDKGIAAVVTADTFEHKNGVDPIVDALYELYEAVQTEPLPEGVSSLEKLRTSLAVKPLENDVVPEPFEVTYAVRANKYGITGVTVHVEKDEGRLHIESDEGGCDLPFGIGCYKEGRIPFSSHKCYASAYVRDKRYAAVKAYSADEELSPVFIQLSVGEDGCGTMLTRTFSPSVFRQFNTAYIIE